MNEIERDIERIKDERRISRLVMERHLAVLDAERKCRNDSLFSILSTGLLIWTFVLLICITIMMFIPLLR